MDLYHAESHASPRRRGGNGRRDLALHLFGMGERMANDIVGGFLRNRRMERGHTQRHVAALAGISPQYLNDLETGRRESLSPEAAARLAEALNVPADTLAWVLVGAYARRFGLDMHPLAAPAPRAGGAGG